MSKPSPRKIGLKLIGLDDNAFSLMGAFARQARKEGWTKNEIGAVLMDATSGNYDYLLTTLSAHCEAPAEANGDWRDVHQVTDRCFSKTAMKTA